MLILIATLTFTALLCPLSSSSPVNLFPRHHRIPAHQLSSRNVFDLPFSGDNSKPAFTTCKTCVGALTAVEAKEEHAITVAEHPAIPTTTFNHTASSSASTLASPPVPTPEPVNSTTALKPASQPQEMLLSVLPTVLLFGGSYRFTFSSWASDSGLLIVGLSGLLMLIHFIVTKSALSAQFKVFLTSCGLLFVASTFSLLQMGAADKEGHKLNVPLFVLSQLHFTVATIGFALWHLMIISDLECWPSLTQSFWCRPGRPFTFSSPPEGRANFTNLISLLRESKVRCSVLAYMVCLAATTMAWRLCMLTSQWAVCIFSRLANLLCLCFLVVFSVLLIRLIIRKPNISSTPLFALAGNIFGLAVLIVSMIYVGTQEAPLGRLWVSIMLLLYFIASLRLAWPLARQPEQTDTKSEAIVGSPLRELRRSSQQMLRETIDDNHTIVVKAPQHHQRQASNGSNFSHSSKSTVSTSLLQQMKSVGDAIEICASKGYQYTGPIPKIFIQPNTSKTTLCSNRPDTARSNYTSTTSGVSTDSDHTHTASAQVFEVAVGVKSNEPPRLVRIATTTPKRNKPKQEPIFASKEDVQAAATQMPSSPTSAASALGDNDERELLAYHEEGTGRWKMVGHPLRLLPAHHSRSLKRSSFTSPAPEGKCAPRFGQSSSSLARPASAEAYRHIIPCSSPPLPSIRLSSTPTETE